MSIGKLYGPPSHPRVQKSLIVSEFNSLNLDYTPDFEFGVDNKKDEYLKKFPLGQTPAFEGPNGLLLTESSAIAFHLCQSNSNTTLLGKNADELAKIWQFVIYVETNFTTPAFKLFKAKFLNEPISIDELSTCNEAFDNCLNYLNGELKGKKYLIGDCISFSDINLICNLYLIITKVMPKKMRDKYPNLTNYYEYLIKFKEFEKYLGVLEYEEK